MFAIQKILNHNAILIEKNQKQYLALKKGIGFGAKAGTMIKVDSYEALYLLEESTQRGDSAKLLARIEPLYLEISDEIIRNASELIGELDRSILLPLGDHIAFAIERMKKQMRISNPFANEIRLLNPKEYEAACKAREIILERTGYAFDEEELGYITLHLHCARTSEQVDEGMSQAILLKESVEKIEQAFDATIDYSSLSYGRFMTHMRFMIARIKAHEVLHLDMDEYVRTQFPKAYQLAEEISSDLGRMLHEKVPRVEIGYLALHIQRVCDIA